MRQEGIAPMRANLSFPSRQLVQSGGSTQKRVLVGKSIWYTTKWAPLKGKIERLYLTSVSGTIAGGTSEIQRNIIAERGLGLPR